MSERVIERERVTEKGRKVGKKREREGRMERGKQRCYIHFCRFFSNVCVLFL